jgi:hypothetical protein
MGLVLSLHMIEEHKNCPHLKLSAPGLPGPSIFVRTRARGYVERLSPCRSEARDSSCRLARATCALAFFL